MQSINNNQTAFKGIVLGKGGKEVLKKFITSDESALALKKIFEEQKKNIAADVFISKEKIAVKSKLHSGDEYIPTGKILNKAEHMYGDSKEYELVSGSTMQKRDTCRAQDGLPCVRFGNGDTVRPQRMDSFIAYQNHQGSSSLLKEGIERAETNKLNAALDIASSMHANEVS